MNAWVIASNGLLVAAIALLLIKIGLVGRNTSQHSRTKRPPTEPSTGSTTGETGTSSEEKIRLLETRVMALELEWSDTYNKLSRLAGRVSKTKALDEAQTLPQNQPTRHELLARARKVD